MKFLKLRKGESNLAIPIAILIAGVLIAGAVLYTNSSKTNMLGGKSADSTTESGGKYAKYVKIAEDIGLDGDKFEACMEKFDKTEVEKDVEEAKTYGANGTPTFFLGVKKGDNEIEAVKLVGAQPFDAFKPVLDTLVETKDINKAIEALPDNMKVDQTGNPIEVKTVNVSLDDDAVRGNKDADVYIVEFSDYECPFCKRYSTTTLKEIEDNYVKSGKVAYVFRDLTLPFHEPVATEEAVAANCARLLGGDDAYYQYHDKIFELTRSNKQGIPE